MKYFSLLLIGLVVTSQAWVPQSMPTKSRSSTTSLSMGLVSGVKRVRDSILSKERSKEDLKIGIAGFYDRSSKLWEDVWGEVRDHSSYTKGNGRCERVAKSHFSPYLSIFY
jgi:hypothetical protein